jgi:hypothetical protein
MRDSEIDNRGQDGAEDDPEELVPIEEGHADKGRLDSVVERRPDDGHELNDEKQIPPAPAVFPFSSIPSAHGFPLLSFTFLERAMGIEPT